MSRFGDRPSFLRLVRFVAAGLLIALGLTLSATALSSYLVVNGALNTVVRGQAEALLQAIERATRGDALVNEEVLKGVLDSEAPRGLRCLVLLDPNQSAGPSVGQSPGAANPQVLSVGRCLTPPSAVGELLGRPRVDELLAIGDRMRMVLGPPAPSAQQPVPHPGLLLPPQGVPPPPGAPWPAGADSVAGPSWPGPPPQGVLLPTASPKSAAGPKWRRAPRPLLIEYAPQMAEQLRQSAQRTLLSGGFATLALLVAAAIFWQLSLREERTHATKERQRQLASLGEMAAVLAHELRNPLAALKGHAQLLLEQMPPGSRTHDKAARVVTESERLEALSEDLLSFVRTTVIEPQQISPADLLAECAQSVAESRIEVTSEQAPARWRLDPVRMRQVLCNLLRNAVEASPPGSRVVASAGTEAGQLVFQIRDFGKGIAETDVEKIFEPFYTTRARGTGLGLPIARRLVALHGGTITASNAPQGGALFRVQLPAVTGGTA